MKTRWLLIVAVATLAGAAAWHLRAGMRLSWWEHKLERQFPVAQIDADSLAALLASGQGSLLLFDTRAPQEYATSRIKGALQVDWNMDEARFSRRFGEMVRGRNVVFYCSIGYRSSAMLQELGDYLDSAGVLQAANLRGGIFRWYNEGRTVVDSLGMPTDSIHPYDDDWARLVKQR